MKNIVCFLALMLTFSIAAEPTLSLINDFDKTVVGSDSSPKEFKIYNDKILFLANRNNTGNSLYSYNTTSSSLEKIAQVGISPLFEDSMKTENGLIFVDDSHPVNLWVSDGTVAGTKIISQLGDQHSESFTFVSKQKGNSAVFFFGEAGSLNLYITDGTSDGTILLESYDYGGAEGYWDLVENIDTDQNNIALHVGEYFYYFDTVLNKHESCFWDTPVEKVVTVNNKIYFKNVNELVLYECDISNKTIKNINEELSLSPTRLNLLLHDEDSIFLGYDTESEPDSTIKYNSSGIVYKIPHMIHSTNHPVIIDGHAVFPGTNYVDDLKITFPGKNAHNGISSTSVSCLEGLCHLLSWKGSNTGGQIWYSKFGESEAQLLHSFGEYEYLQSDGVRKYQLGAAIDDKLIIPINTWDHGFEPRLLDLTNNVISLIEDLNPVFNTNGSDIESIQVKNNQVFVYPETITGRELWRYDPIKDEVDLIDDRVMEFRDIDPRFIMRDKLYYTRAASNGECSFGGIFATEIYNLETKSKRRLDCGSMPWRVTPFEDGFLYIKRLDLTYGGALFYFEPPIFGYKTQQVISSANNAATSIEVYEGKAYVKREKDFVVLDSATNTFRIFEIPEAYQYEISFYVGAGQWLFANGIKFDGENYVQTPMFDLISERKLFVRYYSRTKAQLSLNNQDYVYDVRADELSEIELTFGSTSQIHGGVFYNVSGTDNTLYKYDLETGARVAVANYDSHIGHSYKFYSHYFYFVSKNYSTSKNELKRVDLNRGNIEFLYEGLDRYGIESMVNDDIGNIYFLASLDDKGEELWKLTIDNIKAGNGNYVIRHDLENSFKFPVNISNQFEEFSILSEPQNGTFSFTQDGFSYKPTSDSSGREVVQYKFTGSSGESNVGVLNLDINQPPIARSDFAATVVDSFIFNPLLNDTDDYYLSTRNIMVVEPPSNGTFNTSTLRIERDGSFVGMDSFTYKLIDEEGDSSEVVKVEIDFSTPQLNSRPEAIDDEYVVVENQSAIIDLMKNDSDPDGDAINYTISLSPENGKLFIRDGALVYEPNQNYNGQDHFFYFVTDTYGQESFRAKVTVNVGVQTSATPESTQSSDGGGGGAISILFFLSICGMLGKRNMS